MTTFHDYFTKCLHSIEGVIICLTITAYIDYNLDKIQDKFPTYDIIATKRQRARKSCLFPVTH